MACAPPRVVAELELLQELRPTAKAAMLTEARRDPAWRVLRTIPYLEPVSVALLLATAQTPVAVSDKAGCGDLTPQLTCERVK
jgi:hypothetical protein